MPRRSLPLAGLIAALVATSALVTVAADETVVIDESLRPAVIEVESGTTVIWLNRDDERHRVRSKAGPVRFDSKNLEPGASFGFTFTVAGEYPYYDHRNRDDAAYFGMIVVGGAALDPDAPLPESGSVSIIDKSFRPGSIVLATGGSVEWSNDDGEAHTVTATDRTWDSGIMNGGASFTRTFAEPGDYAFFCLIHPEMRGTITVADQIEPLPAGDEAVEGDPDAVATQVDSAVAPPDLDAALGSLELDAPTGPTVSMIERAFQPAATEVTPGQAVTWTNDDTEGHTVTAVDGSFNSGIMTVGDEFSMPFDSVGTFDYFCAIHPEMVGTVTVGEATP